MTDVKTLLDAAYPLPWVWEDRAIRPEGERYPVLAGMLGLTCINLRHEDAALIVHAVNRLPDYEAAVDALERLTAAAERLDPTEKLFALDQAHAALSRLRGET